MTFRRAVVATHRWIGVIAALLWLLQALTGVLIVFHWEIDDAITPGAHRATDWNAIEKAVEPMHPSSMWTTAGKRDRYDVFVDDGVIRIDGAGNVLRKGPDGGIVEKVVVLHQSLLAGKVGRRINGTSGLFLLSNLTLGIIAAWPRRGQWKRALSLSKSPARIATLYSWHRALGLWLVIPAFVAIAAGVFLAFDFDVARDPEPPPVAGVPGIGLTEAVGRATGEFGGAEVSGISFPTKENATWTFTLKQHGEVRRAYGKSRLFLSAVDGRVLGRSDALRESSARKFVDYLFSFHTGEVAGLGGRLIVLTIGLWLISMILLGLALWQARRAFG